MKNILISFFHLIVFVLNVFLISLAFTYYYVAFCALRAGISDPFDFAMNSMIFTFQKWF